MEPPKSFFEAVQCCTSGDLPGLLACLKARPNWVKDRSGPPFEATLLHYAAAANGVEDEWQRTPPNAVEICAALLDAGAEPDALGAAYGGGENATPLCLLVSSWHPFAAGLQAELVQLLVEGGAAVNGLGGDGMPLATALVFGYTRAAESLVHAGARVDIVLFAAGLGDLALVRSFFDPDLGLLAEAGGTFRSPILGDRELTPEEAPAVLLQDALHFAVTHGQLDVARYLVDRGASVRRPSLGHHCELPLAQALFVQEFDAARWLLAEGADLDAIDGKRGVTPRSMAAGKVPGLPA